MPENLEPVLDSSDAARITEIREAIRTAVRVFATSTDSDNRRVLDALEREGLVDEMARSLVEFVPLAFGRAFLEGTGVIIRDDYIRIDAQGRTRFCGKLLDEPIYKESLAIVPEVAAQGKEALLAIVWRSPESRAANEMFNAGRRPGDLYCCSPVLFWREGMPESGASPQAPGALEWSGSVREEVTARFRCPKCGRNRDSPDADCATCGWRRLIRSEETSVATPPPREKTPKSWWQFWRWGPI
jgi:hypothetical protein